VQLVAAVAALFVGRASVQRPPRAHTDTSRHRQQDLGARAWEREQLLAASREDVEHQRAAKGRRPRWAMLSRGEHRAVREVLEILERTRDRDGVPLWGGKTVKMTEHQLRRMLPPPVLLGGSKGGRPRGTWLRSYVEQLDRVLSPDGGPILRRATRIHEALMKAGHDPTNVTVNQVRHMVRPYPSQTEEANAKKAKTKSSAVSGRSN
jgi:hypothetical protein